jgi:hypothetical protein
MMLLGFLMMRSWFSIVIVIGFHRILAEVMGLIYITSTLKEDEYGDYEYNDIHDRRVESNGSGCIEKAHRHYKH